MSKANILVGSIALAVGAGAVGLYFYANSKSSGTSSQDGPLTDPPVRQDSAPFSMQGEAEEDQSYNIRRTYQAPSSAVMGPASSSSDDYSSSAPSEIQRIRDEEAIGSEQKAAEKRQKDLAVIDLRKSLNTGTEKKYQHELNRRAKLEQDNAILKERAENERIKRENAAARNRSRSDAAAEKERLRRQKIEQDQKTLRDRAENNRIQRENDAERRKQRKNKGKEKYNAMSEVEKWKLKNETQEISRALKSLLQKTANFRFYEFSQQLVTIHTQLHNQEISPDEAKDQMENVRLSLVPIYQQANGDEILELIKTHIHARQSELAPALQVLETAWQKQDLARFRETLFWMDTQIMQHFLAAIAH